MSFLHEDSDDIEAAVAGDTEATDDDDLERAVPPPPEPEGDPE